MLKLKNRIADQWIEGQGTEATLVNPATDEVLAECSTKGIDRKAALAFARAVGGKSLRAMTFAQRAKVLESWSQAIHGAREELIDISMKNGGNTRGDAKFDLDGATGTLMAYAEIGQKLGDVKVRWDGDAIDMGRTSKMQGRHVFMPRDGCAIHINAFNFPAWGFAEKAACAILAGMPILLKPATLTAMPIHRIVEILVEKGLVPAGVLSFLCGSAGDLLDHTDFQDVIAFTGSASTGKMIRTHPVILDRGVRVGIEADSLNAAILGPDVDADSETFDLFVNNVFTEMTQKTGQKCTAIRRVLLPESAKAIFLERLTDRLARLVVGHPDGENVRMGPLAGPGPLKDARQALDRLLGATKILWGDPKKSGGVGIREGQGAFLHPLVLEATSPTTMSAVHEVEVFGPVTTVCVYDGDADTAAKIIRLGQGSLVASFYSDDREWSARLIDAMGAYQGRLVWGSKKIAASAAAPGTVFPQFIHGGPGRAGAGEELGGLRGLELYSQRTAIQGYGPLLEKLFTA